MIQHYIKVACRNLLKYKTQNLISIVGLAVGLLCFSICLYCSRYMQSMDQCFDNYSRLVEIQLVNENETMPGTPSVLADELRNKQGSEVVAYSSVAYALQRPFDVYLNDEKKLPYEFECIEVDSYFNVLFTPTILAGTWDVAAITPHAVVLTESIARKVFPTIQDAIGKRMVMTCRLGTSPDSTPRSGGISYTIQAVIKDIPTNVSMSFMRKMDAIILNDSEGEFWNKDVGNNYAGVNTYALLHEGKDINKLNKIYRKNKLTHEMHGRENEVVASPIGEKAKCSEVAFIFELITGLVGILILIVSLLNFFHFQIGSMINRCREFSIRKVLGNNTIQLSGLLFTQMLFVIGIAFVLMVVMLELLSPKLKFSLFDFNLKIDATALLLQSGEYLVCILMLSLIICVLTSLYIRKMSVQKGISHGMKNGRNLFRNFMQGVQFFICWLFVSMTVALYLQSDKTTSALFNTLSKSEKRSILSLPLNYSFMKNDEKTVLINRIRQYSGVKDILLTDYRYLSGTAFGAKMQLEKDNPDRIEVNQMQVNSNFISFMNIPLLSGRNMKNIDDIYVDDVFVKQNSKEVLGTNLFYDNYPFTVCGIISSFSPYVYNIGREQIPYVFFLCNFNDYVGHCYIKCHVGKEKEVFAGIIKIMKEILPENIEPEISTFWEDINEAQALETKLKDIILFFSIVCLIITLLGVYAAITLDTERRQKEVAIRKVNGAGMKQIIGLFARLYILQLTITALIAFPVVYVTLQMWKEMYKVFFNAGVLYWGGIFLAVTLLTGFTVMFKILRIAHLNPAEVIKSE